MAINDNPGIIYTNNLYGNYPHPFNPNTTIRYSLKDKSKVIVQIYDVTGQLIRTLFDGVKNSGTFSIEWDGRNNRGELQATGIYFYRLKIGNNYNVSKKMVLLR